MRSSAAEMIGGLISVELSGCLVPECAGLSRAGLLARDVAMRWPESGGHGQADNLVPGGKSGGHLTAVLGVS
jgi:hypothetical protein